MKKEVTRIDGVEVFFEARQQLYNEPEMTLDEINAEISDVRASRKSNDQHI
ncbi:hypothetical protein [Agathobacter sp.]